MAKKIVLGIILLSTAILAIFLISALNYDNSFYNSQSEQYNDVKMNSIYDSNDNALYKSDNIKDTQTKKSICYNDAGQYQPEKIIKVSEIKESKCFDEYGQSRGPGECIGVPQEKKQCYKQVITCSGTKTIYINCYNEVEQDKGEGECLNIPQEKGQCYKQIESCSGTKTISIDCYPTINQEKGYGECLNLPQEKSQCYRIKDYLRCPNNN